MSVRNLERLALILFATVLLWRLPDVAGALQKGSKHEDEEIRQELAEIAQSPMAKAFTRVARVMAPSVVHIRVQARTGSEGVPGRPVKGSGVIITGDGLVMTNYHVIETPGTITVALFDDRQVAATIVGGDKLADIAVIRLAAGNYTAAALGDSDTVAVGDFVLACGSPFGLSHSVSAGIISARGRTDIGVANYEDFLQTDAAINPGNSGGPLCNLRGEVIGINAAIASRTGGYTGVGFAIPINMARKIADQLARKGQVDRAFLGVQIRDLSPDAQPLPKGYSHGVHILSVVPDSPAEKAGLLPGDIILKVNGKTMRNANSLRNDAAFLPIRKPAEVLVLRRKQLLHRTVVPVIRPRR